MKATPSPVFPRQSPALVLFAALFAALVGPTPLHGQSSPVPALNFAAQDDTGWLPPDTHGAVGPNHVVTAVNGGVRIQNRSGAVLKSSALNTFLNRTDSIFDPKVFYDHFADRWLLAACANASSANSAVIVAASQTADPTGAWWVYSFDADASNNVWADYPSVGFNKDWFAVGMNMFQLSGSFSTGRLYVMPRATLYTGASITANLINDSSFTLVPAVTHDATLATLYVLQTWNGNSGGRGYLRLLALTGAVNAPQLGEIGRPSTTQTWLTNSASGGNILPQAGGGPLINGGDDRMQHVVYRNGSLWAAHNGYATSGGNLRSFVQWWQITPQAQTLQYGRIDDTGGTFHYCFPSIGVNRNGDVLLGCTRFSAGTYASAAYAFRGSGDTAGTLRAPHIFAAGGGIYQKNDSGGRNRWGDYSATMTDPVDDTSFWTIQEYALTGNRWSTSWARVVPPDSASVIRFSTSTFAVGEAAGTATIAVTRSGNLRSTVTVHYATSNGSALAGSDYTAGSGTLTFGDNEETKTFSVPITNDTGVEADETVTLTLSAAGAGATLGSPAAATLTIADNDVALPVVTVAASDNSASEPADPGVFTLTRSGSTAVALTVNYAMSGSASNSTDYAALGGSVTIPAGSATSTVTLTPIDDAAVESTETATLTLSPGAAYTSGSPNNASISLYDNDQTPVVTIQASDAAASEAGDAGQFTVTRSGGTTAALTVNLTASGSATAGADFTTLPASLSIPAGAATATVSVIPLDDVLVEGGETIILSVSAGSGYVVGSPASATVTLADNDAAIGNDAFAARLAFAGLNVNGVNTTATKETGEPNHAGNAGGRSVWWTWTAPFSGSVTFSTEGSGFDTLLAVYTGSGVAALTSVASDDDSGSNRTSRATFSAVSGTVYQIAVDGYGGASGSIILSRTADPVVSASVTLTASDATATEGGTDTGTFTLARTGNTASALSIGLAIGGTATNATDYQSVATSFTLPAGSASATLTVTPLDDAQIEGPETVTLTLQAGTAYTLGSPSTATVTINDNDSTVGNDAFGNAALMTAATDLGTNTGATKETGEPSHASNSGGKSVWWNWTATFSGPVGFRTEGSTFDTLLAVYTGSSVAALSTVASDDDSGPNQTSVVTFSAVLGTVYHIAVDGYDGASGSITLTRSGDPVPVPLVTVSASDATAKEGSGDTGRFLINRTGATTNSLAVTVSFSGTAANGSDYTTLATTQTIPAGAGSLQVVVTPLNDTLAEGDETVVMAIEPGTGYQPDGDAIPYAPGGRATAMVTITDDDTGTSNDAFVDRHVLSGTVFATSGVNSTFTKEAGEPSHAGNAGGKSAWWRWTAPATGTYTITTDGSSFDTLLAVYTGTSVSSLTWVAGDDDSGPGLTSQVTFTATAGTIYQIAVDGYTGGSGSTASGAFTLSGSGGAMAQPPVLTGPASANAAVGLPFSYTITATGNPASFGTTGLPAGLTMNPATGVITGSPAPAGNYLVSLSATNAGGTGTADLTLSVKPAAAGVFYQTDFTSFPAGYGQVTGNDGWLGDSGGHGTYNGLPGRGQCMYVGYDLTYMDDTAYFWRPLNQDPLSTGSPVVRLTAEIAVMDSTNGLSDGFGYQIYNKDGQYLAAVIFDNQTKKIYLHDGVSATNTDTGKTFTAGVFTHFEVEVDFATNTWAAWNHGIQLFGPRPFHLGGKSLTLGDVTVFWDIQTPGFPGNNLLFIDNFSVTAGPAATSTFTHSGTTTIPTSGSASPYPSTLGVSGLDGQLSRLTVRLQGVTHTNPDDLDILLVAPDGRGVILMSDAGGSDDYANHTITIDDLAPTGMITDYTATHSARYRPTDFSEGTADSFPANAPAAPYLTTLSSLHGINPNGEWKLYVVDDSAVNSGAIAGWSLEIGATASLSQNFAGWRAGQFTGAEIAAGLGNESADPDGDGINNLLEFAMNLQPRRADRNSANVPKTTMETYAGQRCLCFQYPRDLSRSGITCALQTSANATAWGSFTGQDVLIQQVGTVQTRKAYLPMATPRALIRLSVSSP
jgi:hypothetical protein